MNQMTLYHRINVWRIANKCPACGSDRGYSQANPGGLEFNCSDLDNCAFNEFVPNATIHSPSWDAVRFEVLGSDNKVKPDWEYHMTNYDKKNANLRRKKYGKRKILYPEVMEIKK